MTNYVYVLMMPNSRIPLDVYGTLGRAREAKTKELKLRGYDEDEIEKLNSDDRYIHLRVLIE